MIKIPTGDHKSENERKRAGKHGHCVVCGKPLNGKAAWLRVWYGADAVTPAEVEKLQAQDIEEGCTGDTGFYPVGSDCLRRHPELVPYVKAWTPGEEERLHTLYLTLESAHKAQAALRAWTSEPAPAP